MSMKNKIFKTLYRLFVKERVYINNNSNNQNKVIIVTGAGSGIGRAITKVLYAQGGKLVLVGRTKEKLKETAKDFKEDRHLILCVDICSDRGAEDIVAKTIGKYSCVDALVNNAGVYCNKSTINCSEEDYDEIMDTNVKAVWRLSKETLKIMKNQKSGTILNIGSYISKNSNVSPNKVLYTTSKSAIDGMSKAMNSEVKEYGVRVNCLMPATAKTFFSLDSENYLSPYKVAELVGEMLKYKEIDFREVVIASPKQNI